MRAINKQPKNNSPLTALCKILCESVFDDICGANETAYNALMILLDAVDKDAAIEIKARIYEKDGRYKYKDG